MEAVAVDAPRFHEWQVAFADRGWPWIQIPKGVRCVWLPAGGPMALAEPGRFAPAKLVAAV